MAYSIAESCMQKIYFWLSIQLKKMAFWGHFAPTQKTIRSYQDPNSHVVEAGFFLSCPTTKLIYVYLPVATH